MSFNRNITASDRGMKFFEFGKYRITSFLVCSQTPSTTCICRFWERPGLLESKFHRCWDLMKWQCLCFSYFLFRLWLGMSYLKRNWPSFILMLGLIVLLPTRSPVDIFSGICTCTWWNIWKEIHERRSDRVRIIQRVRRKLVNGKRNIRKK